MRATITINMDNAAFDDTQQYELARILAKLANTVQGSSITDINGQSIRDINGNVVGSIKITGRR